MLSHALRAKVQNSTIPTNSDPNFNQVSLLLHGDGTNGAQNNTFIDSSTNNFSITRAGNTTQGTNTPFSQPAGAFSNFFDGTGDYFTVASNTALDLSADFTIEAFVYPVTDTASELTICCKRANSSSLAPFILTTRLSSGNYFLSFSGSTNGSSWNINGTFSNGTNALSKTSWNHVAVCKNGTTITTYVNGVVDQTFTSVSNLFTNTAALSIAASAPDGGTPYNGYVSNFRIVKGTAVYTSAFTPPTAPLTAITNTSILTCQSNRFIDNSSNNFTLTRNGDVSVQPFSPFAPTAAYSTSVNGGSLYFDGTGDNLKTPSSSVFNFGTGDFTVELWFYPTTIGRQHSLVDTRSTNTNGWVFYINTSNQLQFYDGQNFPASTATIIKDAWTHIAFARSGTTIKGFFNGVEVISASNSRNNATNVPATVGSSYEGSGSSLGYISDVRILKGTALYTTAFTPPTAPLTAITNTSLLLSGTNAGIFDNAAKNDLETVGNAQVSTSVTKFGTGSMSFDGTGDWLIAPDSLNLQFGTGNFTIEGWVYLNAIGSARGFVSKGTSTTGWSLGTNSSNQVVFSYASSTITSTGTLAVSTWYFVTVVREGTGTNQTKIYINGTNDGTGTVSTNFNQTNIMYVGADRVGGSALNGYIDDLRITRGVARYTATFTPPTAAFPNQ